MSRQMQWVRAALLVCAMVWFVSCSTDESPVASDQAYDAAEELARETFYNDAYNVIQRVKTLAPSATFDYDIATLLKDCDVDGCREIMDNMRRRMSERIGQLDWLSSATKARHLYLLG